MKHIFLLALFFTSSFAFAQEPSITHQPQGDQIPYGIDYTFFVTATGEAPLSYKWYKHEGTTLLAVTSEPYYTIRGATLASQGHYRVQVSNSFGQTYSQNAYLHIINSAARITSTNMSDWHGFAGDTIDFSIGVDGIPYPTIQWFKDGHLIEGVTGTSLSIQSAKSEDSGIYYAKVINPIGTETTESYHVDVVESPTIIGEIQDINTIIGASFTIQIQARGSPLTFQLYRDHFLIKSSQTGVFAFENIKASDDGQYEIRVNNAYGDDSRFFHISVHAQSPEVSMVNNHGAYSLNVGESLTVNTISNHTEHYQWYFEESPIAGETSSSLTLSNVTFDQEGHYSVRAWNDAFGSNHYGHDSFNLQVNGDAPIIISHPDNQEVYEGEPVTLTAAIEAMPTATYQWYKNGQLIFSGSRTFKINQARSSDTGLYTITASNSLGFATSNTASIVVRSAPSILLQPIAKTEAEYGMVTFSVSASGTPPLYYQWRKNETDLPGGTTPTLVLQNLKNQDSGNYSVRVWNSQGEIVSEIVPLTVVQAPTFAEEPLSQEVTSGDEVVMHSSVVGSEPLYLEWQKDGSPITGANTESYHIPSASYSADYQLVAWNAAGMTNSQVASLAVEVSQAVFNEWILQFDLPTGQDTYDADPNGDGVSNLLAFAMGLSPLQNASAFLPTIQTNGNQLEMVYSVAKNIAGVSIVVESSTNLVTWTTDDIASNVLISETDTTETRKASCLLDGTAKFMRVRVVTQ